MKTDPFKYLTFEEFKKCLKLEYSVENFPKVSGIYAYYNEKKDLIYIGQSVNMNTRLKQHFRNGKVKISGHDVNFKNLDDWKFYVLEFVRKNKKLLDEREAYWIVLSKVATRNKESINLKNALQVESLLMKDKQVKDVMVSKKVLEKAKNINLTKGNKIK